MHLWKVEIDSSQEKEKEKEKRLLIASSRVTFLSNMPVPEEAKHAADAIRKYAKL